MKLTELDVWNASMDLAAAVYTLSDKFPETQIMGLGYQLRHSASCLPSNIGAAASRKYGKESLAYLQKAKGYLFEIESYLYLAEKLNYITNEELEAHLDLLDSSKRLLFGFIKYYNKAS